jgi:hypothetical protein
MPMSSKVNFSLLFTTFFVATAAAVHADTTARQILICSSSQASPGIRKMVDEFATQADKVPVLAALISGNEASGIAKATSEDLLAKKAYDTAAHNHLVVIGLRSQDPVLDKTWGYIAGLDEAKKSFYSSGFGYMSGDIGYVESDRNPFLHSRKIKSALEDTVLIKISGTTEAGVAAAIKAFEGGLLNGFVPAGPRSVHRARARHAAGADAD